ncbi:MAG: hypothetical protein JXB07_18250 [Anaerolineae bacterium]|nr:hypothetical protein [Anaerolineae bacterium]
MTSNVDASSALQMAEDVPPHVDPGWLGVDEGQAREAEHHSLQERTQLVLPDGSADIGALF